MRAAALREAVCRVNRELWTRGLVSFTWGNASGVDREEGLVAIKPSGVPYDHLQPQDIVLLDLESGEALEGGLFPSTDTPTHLELYRAFAEVGGVVHTHSPYATAWAQARRDLPPLGTTHADYFRGAVPCVPLLPPEEVLHNYERHTGRAIVHTFVHRGLDPLQVPAALLEGHAPFAWGRSPKEALEHAVVLEEVARLAWYTLLLTPGLPPLPAYLVDKHYLRKHGPQAYYGQPPKEEKP